MKRLLLPLFAALLAFAACKRSDSSADPEQLTIGISFETLQTEFWVAAFDAFRDELESRNIRVLEAVAEGDANRQLEQIRSFIARGVDGVIVAPKDAQTIIPAIRAANAAGIPFVSFNRPPAPSDAQSIVVAADNYAITVATVEYMVEVARQTGRKHKAAILIGDLGDINSIGRRDGFDHVVAKHPEIIEVVARIPTEWNQEKAQAGLVNALQAHPDISFIFTSSDFLLPSIVSALKSAGKYHKIGEPGHVILGGFDGDSYAYQLLREGYLDADGVQDLYFEASSAIQALLDHKAGNPVPARIDDPGFVIHQGNLDERAPRMWGAQVRK
jgi:inositol transport system substrate-binding protein